MVKQGPLGNNLVKVEYMMSMAILFYSWFWISLAQLYVIYEIFTEIKKIKNVFYKGPFNPVEGFKKIKYYKNTFFLKCFTVVDSIIDHASVFSNETTGDKSSLVCIN